MFTGKRDLKPLFGTKLTMVDEPAFGYEIHIAKTSAGWKPCFEAHEHIRSVADLKMLYDKEGVIIYDEYGTEYDWDAFVERVVNFGDDYNWRTHKNNDCEWRITEDYEFTSVDGYRFVDREFC
jgi:hypothetical protein